MSYEVEMKFAVADAAAIETTLAGMGASISSFQSERDLYFAHPARDFASTDEAFRIRRKGDSSYVTYKGPKIDARTKTRHEIDLSLPPGERTAEAWINLFHALGFADAGVVEKRRRKAHVDWRGRRVEVSLDEVAGLGDFVELELIAENDDVAPATACIVSLAERLGLADSERRSYLELLLHARGSGSA